MSWLALPAAVEARRTAALPAGAAWRLVLPAAVAALLGIARLLPETGFGLWLRLAAATLVLLLAGTLVARCLGQRSAAATFATSVTLVGMGLALTFALGASIDATLTFVLGAGALAFVWSLTGRQVEGVRLPGGARFMRGVLVLAGIGLGIGVWFVQGVFAGDAFFHLGRVRKLDTLHSLSLHDVGEFARGGLHPGYAFPMWHAWLALVARLAGVDPTSVAAHEASILVPLALILAFEMGWAIFRSTGLALAVVLGQVAIKAFAPGHGGVYSFLWEPSTVATQLLVPAAVAFFFHFVRRPTRSVAVMLAATSVSLALVHPTYALFLAIPLGAFVLARALLTRGTDLRNGILAFAVFGVPMAMAFLWLEPVVRQTIPVSPGPAQLAKNLYHYRHDLEGWRSLTRYNLAPNRIDRNGSVAVAALLLAPLAFFARRRRWGALVLGGAVAILGIELWPLVFPHFSDAVSLSQSRRAGAFIPFAVALAGGSAVVSRFSRTLAVVGALALGIWLEIDYTGDFGLRAPRTEPAWVVWFALYGSIAAVVVAAILAWRRRAAIPPVTRQRGITTACAVFLFVLPVVVHGFSYWSPPTSRDSAALTPGLIRFLQHDVAPRSVVLADLPTSYRATAFAPVYVVAVPPTHAANTRKNQLHKRKRAVLRFLDDPTLGVAQTWRAQWIVLTREERFKALE
ncbi:MAG TPA: hypothetical protein VKB70_05440, partial [Gaiellaceae bacterium]|nr:hypothetical protein [Gaiellaceae bacterium]